MSRGEERFDERQHQLHIVDTRESRPQIIIAPVRHKRRTRWERFFLRVKAIFLRPTR